MAAASPVCEPLNASPLFLLPSELRRRIYDFYLSLAHDDFADTLRPVHAYLDAGTLYATPLPSLMLACKSAYRELAPLVYTTAVLRIYRPGSRNERRIGFAAYGTLRFERLRRLVLVVDLEYVYWNAWLDFFAAVIAQASRLEHLTVDWAPRPTAHPRNGYGWEARRDEKKERAFLDLLYGSVGLQTLRLYGRIPERWTERVQQGGTAMSIICYSYRWWREPGMD